RMLSSAPNGRAALRYASESAAPCFFCASELVAPCFARAVDVEGYSETSLSCHRLRARVGRSAARILWWWSLQCVRELQHIFEPMVSERIREGFSAVDRAGDDVH
ncbi:MAG: hypothetical protein AAFV29_10955, partial [Myxococcota bacterium]